MEGLCCRRQSHDMCQTQLILSEKKATTTTAAEEVMNAESRSQSSYPNQKVVTRSGGAGCLLAPLRA